MLLDFERSHLRPWKRSGEPGVSAGDSAPISDPLVNASGTEAQKARGFFVVSTGRFKGTFDELALEPARFTMKVQRHRLGFRVIFFLRVVAKLPEARVQFHPKQRLVADPFS